VRAHKIAVCHIASGDRWAGAEAQIATLLKSLVRHDELQLSAILLNHGRLAAEIQRCGIEVAVIPENQNGFLAILSEATRFLRGKGVRIVHSHRYKENLLAALLARRCRISFAVRTQHGLPEPVSGIKRLKQAMIQWVDQLIARRATDRLISVSSEMTRQLARRVNPQRIVTIPNGINPEEIRSDLSSREAKDRLGIPRDCWVLGAAGRLEPVKRLDVFLEAAKLIQAHLPNTRFVIAGDGSEEVRLRALALACGLQDKVLFLGHRNDIYDVLRAFDVLILCSDHEGLPMALLEALGLGVVVVARAVGGIPEVVQDGVNGILVDSNDPRSLADACVQVLADRARSQRLTEAGIKSVREDYSAAKTADRVAQLYFSLCEQA